MSAAKRKEIAKKAASARWQKKTALILLVPKRCLSYQDSPRGLLRPPFVMSAEKPIGVALVVCDQILEDSTSKKRSLIGLFNSVQCADFPALLHKMCVFTSITQLNGSYEVELRCTNEHSREVIISAKGNAGSTDPNAVLEIGFEFASFSFPKPGLYGFEFLCNGEIILCTRFNVFRVSNK